MFKTLFITCFIFLGSTTADWKDLGNIVQTQFPHCFNEQKVQVLNAQAVYNDCVRRYISVPVMPDNNVEKEVENILQQVCSNELQIQGCHQPYYEVLKSCMNLTVSADFEDYYQKAATALMQYICKDEGKKFADLLADQSQVKCLGKIPEIIKDGKCPFPDLRKLQSSPDCEERHQVIECFTDNLKKKCDKHEIIDYICDAYQAAMDASSCKSYFTTTVKH